MYFLIFRGYIDFLVVWVPIIFFLQNFYRTIHYNLGGWEKGGGGGISIALNLYEQFPTVFMCRLWIFNKLFSKIFMNNSGWFILYFFSFGGQSTGIMQCFLFFFVLVHELFSGMIFNQFFYDTFIGQSIMTRRRTSIGLALPHCLLVLWSH